MNIGYGQQPKDDIERFGRRAAPRDAFPVFQTPKLVTVKEAKILDEEWVIGISLHGESKAYPIAVMGIHELGNDICGGEPIAVSW